MKIKIAIPDSIIYKPLVSELDNSKYHKDLIVINTSENEAAQLLKDGKVDLALLTPLSYSSICKNIDLRVLPATALAARGYSELYSISFKQNLKSLDSVHFPKNADFAKVISKTVLAERYELEPEDSSGSVKSENDIDAFFSYYGEDKGDFNIDITEDWFDTFEFMLPIAFWVVKTELEDITIIDIVNSLRDSELSNIEKIDELTDNDAYDPREGELYWYWNEEFEKALDETLDLLFYRFEIPDLIDVKIFGRDYDSGIDDEL